MKPWHPILIFFNFLFPAVIQPEINRSVDSPEILSIKQKWSDIDNYVYVHRKELIVLAKVSGKKKLLRVINDNWPDETEYTYNVLKDHKGHIIMIAQMPYSEAGIGILSIRTTLMIKEIRLHSVNAKRFLMKV